MKRTVEAYTQSSLKTFAAKSTFHKEAKFNSVVFLWCKVDKPKVKYISYIYIYLYKNNEVYYKIIIIIIV